MKNGKSKGSRWERNIAKYLTKWLTGFARPYYYWRSPGSGSVATITENNKHITGDIVPLKEEARFLTDVFSIELKNGYPKTNFFSFFSGDNFNIEKFWKQCVDNANDKYPMLIYKKNRKVPIVGITKEIKNKLRIKKLKYIKIKFDSNLPDVYIFNMQDFFDLVRPEDINGVYKDKT